MPGPREERTHSLGGERRLGAPHETGRPAQVELLLHLVGAMPGEIRQNQCAGVAVAKKPQNLHNERPVPLQVRPRTSLL